MEKIARSAIEEQEPVLIVKDRARLHKARKHVMIARDLGQ
jgi:hypothetical protein